MPCNGAILADGMGLGKTVVALSLIVVATPAEENGGGESSEDRADSGEGGRKRRRRQRRTAGRPLRRPTLVVCPLAVLRQWEAEAARHLKRRLKIVVHHGTAAE